MNFSYCISKYNPAYRNKSGTFTKNEWTSYHDIGYMFDNTALTLATYLNIENAYIMSVIEFMKCTNVSSFYVVGLEKIEDPKYDENSTVHMNTLYKKVTENYNASLIDIIDICRLILREHIWCKLENNNKLCVHFGYDFYMYIVSNSKCKNTFKYINDMGLFIESFRSPYI